MSKERDAEQVVRAVKAERGRAKKERRALKKQRKDALDLLPRFATVGIALRQAQSKHLDPKTPVTISVVGIPDKGDEPPVYKVEGVVCIEDFTKIADRMPGA